MFGTRTLKGLQRRQIFVAETGQEYYIVNYSTHPKTGEEKYVLLQEIAPNRWYLLRQVMIRTIDY